MKVIAYFISALISVGIVVFAVKQIVSLVSDVRGRVKKKSSGEVGSGDVDAADHGAEKEVKK